MKRVLAGLLTVGMLFAACSLNDTPDKLAGASGAQATTPGSSLPLTSPGASIDTPLPTPSADPTPTPGPTPIPPATEAQLAAACFAKGVPIPVAAKYAGKSHPIVVVSRSAGSWALGTGDYDADDYGINSKWYDETWGGPIQLVACVDPQKATKVSSCGSYRRSSDGRIGSIYRYHYSTRVRIVVARTGKLLQSKTYYGSTPKCSQILWLNMSGPPPWRIYGSSVTVATVNKYVTAVSTQKVK